MTVDVLEPCHRSLTSNNFFSFYGNVIVYYIPFPGFSGLNIDANVDDNQQKKRDILSFKTDLIISTDFSCQGFSVVLYLHL